MPLASIATEALGGVVRVVVEVLFEVVCHGTGRVILRPWARTGISEAVYTAVGLVFWLVVGLAIAIWIWSGPAAVS